MIIKILVVRIVKIEEKIVERIVLQGKKNAGIIKIHAVKKEGSVEKIAGKIGRTESTVFSERAIEETREEQTVINVVKIDIKDRMIAGITAEIAKTTEERIVRNAEKTANRSVTSDLLTDEHVFAGSDAKIEEKLEGPTMEQGHSFPEQELTEVMSRFPNIGIAFSGGGSRSAVASFGTMRALHQMGLDKEFRYVGANSGGAWFVSAYSFLPEELTDEEFFGDYLDFSKITNFEEVRESVDSSAFLRA